MSVAISNSNVNLYMTPCPHHVISYAFIRTHSPLSSLHLSCFLHLSSLPSIFCLCCYFFPYHIPCCLAGLAARVTLGAPPIFLPCISSRYLLCLTPISLSNNRIFRASLCPLELVISGRSDNVRLTASILVKDNGELYPYNT